MKESALSPSEYQRFVRASRLQPAWRREADRCADYYDGNQIDAATARQLEERGLGPLVANGIKPVVNALLGNEAKTRMDWRVRADDDAHTEIAEALSSHIAEVERETRADQAISEAYAWQIKAGLGFVEVGRNPDVLGYPYRVEAVHRREIWWDWSARKPDLSDAQWLPLTKSRTPHPPRLPNPKNQEDAAVRPISCRIIKILISESEGVTRNGA
ncbi:MAG: hypothetical protein LBL72_09070 [Candidatus Accumulibacter sp.]|jgi:hypothetical protein|nr:hypothetical protein [Accumulibacter sp.]